MTITSGWSERGVQQDDLGGITLLNPVLELDVRELGLPTEPGCQRVPFTRLPAEGLIERHRLDRDQLGAVLFAECECVLERPTRRFREIDRDENAREPLHDAASRLGE